MIQTHRPLRLRRALLALVAVLGSLSLSVGSATAQPELDPDAATVTVEPGPDNTGLLTGEGPVPSTEELLAQIQQVEPRTPQDFRCTGLWQHPVSNVTFQRGLGGTVAWGFRLTGVARSRLGFLVEVSMPYAAVNDRGINPPYQPHLFFSWYNFHGSINNYQLLGGGSGRLATGDKLTLLWLIEGVTGAWATRYITCQVPPPGSA